MSKRWSMKAWFRKARTRKFWPQKLLSQMIILVVLALILAQGISLWILSSAYRSAMLDNSERHILRQFVSAVTLMEQMPPELHRNILRAWRRPGQSFFVREQLPDELNKTVVSMPEQRMEQALVRWLGDEYQGRVRVLLELGEQHGDREGRDSGDSGERGRDGDHDHRDWRQRPPPLPVRQLMIAVRLN
ncbi:hypothetical protein, partial [Pseudomaricurvus sp.]|uniref:hypothetical protein n=1 Tax=Pseudomaricurvus sp. TaxID=2004510 RepID=UPI003F6CD20C